MSSSHSTGAFLYPKHRDKPFSFDGLREAIRDGFFRRPDSMLDPRLLRQDITQTAANLARRGYSLDLQAVGRLEEQRKQRQVEVDGLRKR